MASVIEQTGVTRDGGTRVVARILQAAAILSALAAAALVVHIAQHGFGLWRAAEAAFFAYFAVQAHWDARRTRDSAATVSAHEDNDSV